MSQSLFSPRRVWRRALIAAVSSTGMLVVGCTQDQPERTASGNSGRSVQASDTSRAQDPAQMRVSLPYPTGNRAGSELLLEQLGPGQARAGQPYTYQVRVTNLTSQPLTGVVLRQRIPGNFKLAENAGVQAPGDQGGDAQIPIGDLGPNQSRMVQVTGTPSGAGTLDTCLSAQYNPPTLCAHVPIVAPAIRAVAQGPDRADVCQDIPYRYTVTNTGTGTAHNVVLQENLPEGLQTTDGQKTISMNVGDLTQGQSKEVTARLRATRPGRYTTQAIVRSDAGDAQTEQLATAVQAPRLAVTMTGPKENYMGQPLAYQILVKNNGDAAAARTRVRLGATPGQVQFVNATGADGAQLASEQQGGGQDLGTLQPGETRTVTVNFNPQRSGAVAVDATAQANCAEPVTTSVNTNIMDLTAAAFVVTHDPDPVPVGSTVTYKITVQNKGTTVDRNVQVTATLPDSEQYVSANGQTNVTNNGQTITFGPIDSLNPKQTASWTVRAKAVRPDQAQFKAQMTSQSTQTPAVKIEPTKLFAPQGGTETRTNEAQQPSQANPPTPAPPPAQPPQDNTRQP